MTTLRLCGALLSRVNTRPCLVVNPVFGRKLSFISTGPRNLVAVQVKSGNDHALLRCMNHQEQQQKSRGHRNLGHRPVPDSLHTKLWMCFLCAMVVGMNLDWKW